MEDEHPLEADPGQEGLAFQVATAWLAGALILTLVVQVSKHAHILSRWRPRLRLKGRSSYGLASPPPLAKLTDLGPSHHEEVKHLVIPSTYATPGAATTPTMTWRGFGTQTISATPTPMTCPSATPASQLLTDTPVVRGIRSLVTPWTKSTQKPTAPPQLPTPVPQCQGWDASFLQSCQEHEGSISSLEGLQQSKEFQSYVRDRYGNLDRHLEQVCTRLQTYRTLRAIDRQGFMHALTRNDIQEFETLPLPKLLGVLDVAITTSITWSLWYASLRLDFSFVWILFMWLAAQLSGAWLHSRPSLLGSWMGVHCVQDCVNYLDHQFLAPAWRVMAAGLLDVVFALVTCTASGVVSAVLILARSERGRRQTCGQLIMDVYPVREVEVGQVTVPIFASPERPTYRTSYAATPATTTATATAVANTPMSTAQIKELMMKGMRRQAVARGGALFGLGTAAVDPAAGSPSVLQQNALMTTLGVAGGCGVGGHRTVNTIETPGVWRFGGGGDAGAPVEAAASPLGQSLWAFSAGRGQGGDAGVAGQRSVQGGTSKAGRGVTGSGWTFGSERQDGSYRENQGDESGGAFRVEREVWASPLLRENRA